MVEPRLLQRLHSVTQEQQSLLHLEAESATGCGCSLYLGGRLSPASFILPTFRPALTARIQLTSASSCRVLVSMSRAFSCIRKSLKPSCDSLALCKEGLWETGRRSSNVQGPTICGDGHGAHGRDLGTRQHLDVCHSVVQRDPKRASDTERVNGAQSLVLCVRRTESRMHWRTEECLARKHSKLSNLGVDVFSYPL